MTYSIGGLIEATDYNTFAGNTTAGLNRVWSTGSGDAGWGQTSISTVSSSGVVTATNWATLVNTLSTTGSQSTTTLTSRTAPVTGNLVAILANVQTDITNCTTNRGNATSSGTISTTWTGSIAKTTDTGTTTKPGTAWTIVWTQTITFASADAARYFWNAGGLVRLDMSKTSTGRDIDSDWNSFVGTVGTLFVSGRVNSAAQTIAGVSYTGFTRSGGSGTPSPNLTTTGWYSLTAGAGATTMWQLAQTVYPYTSEFIRVTAAVDATRTILTLVTTWNQGTQTNATGITGGTNTASPYTAFGTAPAVLCRFIPPSTAQGLSDSWGTPTVASSIV